MERKYFFMDFIKPGNFTFVRIGDRSSRGKLYKLIRLERLRLERLNLFF